MFKENGIVDKEKIDEFTETCNDDYNLGLENGLSETEAFNNALRMLDDSIEVKRYNKHSFIFRISIIFFCFFCYIIYGGLANCRSSNDLWCFISYLFYTLVNNDSLYSYYI